MNPVETFSEFSQKLTPTDLMLYAGVGLVIWVLFKDRMSPVQSLIVSLVDKVKGLLSNNTVSPVVTLPTVSVPTAPKPVEDVFFKLVVSWKQTRDLALQAGCEEAVKVADQMFPFLSPNVCGKKEVS